MGSKLRVVCAALTIPATMLSVAAALGAPLPPAAVAPLAVGTGGVIVLGWLADLPVERPAGDASGASETQALRPAA